MFSKLPKLSGICPEKLFPQRLNSSKYIKFPISIGTCPEKLFPPKTRKIKLFIPVK